MKTFGELTSEVLRYGFDDGPQVNKARIEDWLNEAQQQIARQVVADEFQEVTTVALTVGTKAYALPANFLRALSVRSKEVGTRLWPISVQQYDALGAPEGPPVQYAIFKRELLVTPIPQATDTLEIRYVKKPTRMTATGDLPTVAEDYLHLLVEYALMRAYRAEDDNEYAQAHENSFKAGLAVYAADNQGLNDRPKQLSGTWGR